MKNKKILFVISTFQQYQSYIKTEALKEIKDQVTFFVTPRLVGSDFGVAEGRVISYEYPSRKKILHRHVFNISTTFMSKRYDYWFRTEWHTKRQKRMYNILSWPILRNAVKFTFPKLAQDKNLFHLIEKINPSLIILPSHAYEGLTVELLRISNKLKIPNFMVIENWDTLANRTLFTIKPDFLGVWSQQQLEQAVSIMGIPKERVCILGTPKFMHYFKPLAHSQVSPYHFKFALYAGMADLFDELSALHKIDEIIEKRKLDLKIVYRPTTTQHTRKCPDVFFEYNFKHVILDTPAKFYYKSSATWDISKDSFNQIHIPDPNYFSQLLSNMEFMICSHTTMMLEAPLFNKRIYALAYDDGIHSNGPHWAYKNFRHMFGIEHLSNIRMVYNKNDMEKIFIPDGLKQLPGEITDIDYFISKEATANYPANLRRVVGNILGNQQ